MPRFDSTGPEGQGPMTGRGMGRCANVPRPGFGQGQGMGRGMSRGAGRGAGRRFCWYCPWRWFDDSDRPKDQK